MYETDKTKKQSNYQISVALAEVITLIIISRIKTKVTEPDKNPVIIKG